MNTLHTAGTLAVGNPSMQLYIRETGQHIATCHVSSFGALNGIFEAEALANARRLALSWNTHDELVAALKAVYDEMGNRISPAAFAEFSESTKSLVRIAFVKVKGQS